MQPAAVPSTVEDPFLAFLQAVLKSGLLNREQVQEVIQVMPAEQASDPKSVANQLVKAGKLTRFQAQMLLAGTTLGLVLGPYHVLSPIGKGGMGSVYLARDSRSQKLVAVKVLPPKKARAEERLLARFRLEMEMSQKVSHPHLTKTFEVGTYAGVNYIAMEYIPGRNLYKLVSGQGPLPVPRAARLFAEVAAGLEHAHSQGLIHRDLKPSNIMVTPDDRAKVLDLGLAFMETDDPGDPSIVGGKGYVLGTMDYLAPEQSEDSSKVDARADIYSLGCTLYFALTRQPPFPGGSSKEKIRRHRTDDPVPVTQLNPTVPIAFAHLLRKMMAKRPEQRFRSAADLRDELRTWVTDEPPPLLVDYPPPITDESVVEVSPENTWEAVVPVPPPIASAPSPPLAVPVPVAKPAIAAPNARPAAASVSPIPIPVAKSAAPPAASKAPAPPVAKLAPPPANTGAPAVSVLAVPVPAAPVLKTPAAAETVAAPAPPSPAKGPPTPVPTEKSLAAAAATANNGARAPQPAPPPFWLDFLVPVGFGSMILLAFWLTVLRLLLGG